MIEQDKERAWQFLTMLSRSKQPTVSMFAYEKRKLESLLPTLNPTDTVINSDGEVTAYLYDRAELIKGLKLKYKFVNDKIG